MNWLKILLQKRFWLNIGIIIILTIIILLITFFSINIYTRHGKSFPLPDFKGLTEDQFQSLIIKNDLRYIIIDSLHLDNTLKGIVVEQVPKAGELVKKNRKIFLTINAWNEEQVLIPNLVNYSLRTAKETLESYELTLGELIYVPSEYTNLVLGQQLYGKPVAPDTTVPKGTKIDLLVGHGLSGELITVPNLKRLEKNVAEQIVHSLNLFIGAVIYDETVITSEDTAKAFVWRQIPSAQSDAMINIGSAIDIWITTNDSLLINEDFEEDSEDNLDFEDELQ